MAKLPVVSSAEAIRVFERVGYGVNHQRGSHIVLRRIEEPHTHLTVPNKKELARGTLRALIRQSGLTVEQFTELLNKK